MDAAHIKKITKALAESVEQSINLGKQKPELLEQKVHYNAQNIHRFVEDLTRHARKSELTLLSNHLPLAEFNAFLQTTNYPILYFEQNGDDIIPVLGGKDLHGKDLALTFGEPNEAYQPKNGAINPVLFQEQPQIQKNGRVLFITTFPMDPLVSKDETLHYEDHQPLTPVQRLVRLLTNERKDIGYIYFYAIVVGLVSLVLPLGVQAIFNLVSSGMLFSSVYVLMTLVILGLIGSGIMQIIQVTLVEILQRRIFTKAAFEFTYRLPRFKAEALFNSHPPELMNRFFDVLTIQKSLPKFLIDLTAAFLQIVFGLLLLSFYHPFFIAFSFIVLLALISIVRLQGKKGLETSIKESKYKYRVVQWLEDIASTLYSFKMAGNSNLPLQKMDALVNNYLNYRTEHFKILKGFYYYALAFKTLIIGGLLVLGTYLLVSRQISLGQFVASEIIIVLLTGAVEKLFLSIDIIFDLLTAVDKIGHVTDLPLEKEGGYAFTPAQRSEGISLKVNNLYYKYPENKKWVLQDINLEVKLGERVCLTGQNGSGKNTLVKIMAGILTDYEGGLLYNGVSLRDLDLTTLRSSIEMNFPGNEIFDGTILENITMGRSGITLDDVKNVLEKLNLTDTIGELPEGLNTPMVSAGKHFALSFVTKISVARSIIRKPKLLIISDSSRDLEHEERLRMIDILTDRNNSWTLLVVSNDADFITACDRVVVMNEGQIRKNQVMV